MLKAGFARLDITPPFGRPLDGYQRLRSVKCILDPIYLNAIALSDGEKTIVMIAGDLNGALDLMRRCWGSMMKKGAKTFWEYANANEKGKPKYFTNCHAWSAGCTYLLSAYVLGVRPLTPGYETLLFAPSAAFDSFEGVIPTVKGLVGVKCESIDGKRKFTLILPKNTQYEAKLPDGADLEVVEYEIE